jgi:hypothetical protein
MSLQANDLQGLRMPWKLARRQRENAATGKSTVPGASSEHGRDFGSSGMDAPDFRWIQEIQAKLDRAD